MPRSYKLALTAFIAVCAGGTSGSAAIRNALAAPPPAVTVSLTPAQAGNFEAALKALAAQGKVGFVAEGIPLRPDLPKNKIPPALSGDLSLDAAVNELAEAYDYEVARRINNLFVLKKRYSDLADLPGVTREEYTLALQDIVRLLAAHGPRPPLTTNTAFVLDFAKSVTPEQREAMRDKGLSVSALTPAQQAQLWRMGLHSTIEIPLRGIKDALLRLRQTPTITLRKGKWAGQMGFGYEFVDTYKRTLFWPVAGGFDASAFYTGADAQDKERQDKERRYSQDLPLLSAINWTGERTLAGVVSGLNARAGSTNKPFVIDTALAAKPITLVGADAIDPARIIAALADVYGLRMVTDEDGTQRLTRRAARAARNFADLPENVRRLFPEPLIRALHITYVENLRERQIQLRVISRDPKTPQEERVRVDQEHNRLGEEAERWTGASPALGLKAGMRLRASVEPRLDTPPGKAGRAIRVETLGAAEQSAFVLAMIAGGQTEFLQTLGSFFRQEPNPVLTHWDNATLQCGPYQQGDKQMYEVKVSVTRTNADNSTDTFTGGITGINYPAP